MRPDNRAWGLSVHPNDEFHPPTNDDPYWSETNWFAFGVPERKLSGWLYPFFRPALGVCSAAVLLWDDQGDQVWNCRYYKQFWHLPMPDGPLSDFTLANGLRYRCTEDEMVYQLSYGDPDGDEISISLTFTAIMPPLGTANAGPAGGHLDQVGQFEGAIKLRGETIPVLEHVRRARPVVGESFAVLAVPHVVGELQGVGVAVLLRRVRERVLPGNRGERHA